MLIQFTGKIRLVNGPTPWIGRVEVFYNGAWATGSSRSYYYDHTFADKAAEVVCKMLKYPTYVIIYSLLIYLVVRFVFRNFRYFFED